MKRRHRKFIGFLFLIVGLALPLYAFTNLSVNAFFARARYVDFRKNFDALGLAAQQRREAELAAYNARINEEAKRAVVDPFAQVDYRAQYDIESIGKDEIFAYIIIPKIDLVKPVFLNATYDHLANGLAQLEGTNLPMGGVNTRCVIAGHRGWYTDSYLLHADELEAGDEIFIDRGSEVLAYKVTDKEVIHESNWDSLQVRPGQDVLTLLTCHPLILHPSYRLLVNATRDGVTGADFVGAAGAVGSDGATGSDGAALENEISQGRADAEPEAAERKLDWNAIFQNTEVATPAAVMQIVIYGLTLLGYVMMAFLVWRFVRFLRAEKNGERGGAKGDA